MCQPGTTLVLVREKTAYSLLFPQRSGPLSPGLAALAWPSSPTPVSSRNSRCPTLCRLPSRALLSSDLERHRHLLVAAVLPEKVWAIPESPWCAALCPCVLMVQSPLSKATWELHSTACWTHSGPTEARSVPTARTAVSLVEPRRKGFDFKADKEVTPASVARLSVGALCFKNTNPEKRQ